MKKLLLAAALCLSVGGCALLPTPFVNGQSVAQSAPGISANAEKALTILHQAYNSLGTELMTNAKSGLLHGAAAASAKSWYDKAGDAILVADRADLAANETGLLAAIADANSAISQAKTLLGAH